MIGVDRCELPFEYTDVNGIMWIATVGDSDEALDLRTLNGEPWEGFDRYDAYAAWWAWRFPTRPIAEVFDEYWKEWSQ
jgi:hypothetical protein